VIDPFLVGNPLAPLDVEDVTTPDLILVTHAASDHVGDAAAIAKRSGAPVVCGGDTRLLLIDQGVDGDQIQATVWGIVTEVAGIVVRPVECHHWSMSRLSTGEIVTGTPLAFIFEPEDGVRVYHYGDTAIFDMRLFGELYRPTIALLGCTNPAELDVPGPGRFLTGELSPAEAAYVAEMLGVEAAVACHYLARNDDVAAFLDLVPARDPTGRRKALAPEVGDTIVVDGADYTIEKGA
jgi:L-ascorbate metabolism protein UlaG (beta-lactamase superfamily)